VKTKVESLPIRMADGDAVRHCDAMLDSVDGILAEKVGDAWGGLGEMRSVMRARVRDIPEPPPPPPPAPEPSAETTESTPSVESSQASSGGGGTLPSVSSPEEVDEALLQLGQAIMGAAAVLRESDATDATAYRLQRVGAWLPIRMLPPAEGVTTMVPGPDTSILEGFAALAAAQAWPGIVGQAERAASESLFWLDVHRWTAFALDRMGAKEARAALGREVVGFVSRLPGIERLCFSDGTPFADAVTKGWLDEERATYGGGGGGGAASRDPLDAGLEDAETTAQSGQLAEALTAVIPLANGIGDPRRRFEIKTRVARMALTGGRNDVARAMLEGLVAEADKHQLETWEPVL
jgi:type VI secretion system protein VasJ